MCSLAMPRLYWSTGGQRHILPPMRRTAATSVTAVEQPRAAVQSVTWDSLRLQVL